MLRIPYPEGTFTLQRRVVFRQFFLKPTKRCREIFWYVLAHAAQKHGIRIHEMVVMSNHYHVVLTDPRGELSDFVQLLDSLLARAMNRVIDRQGIFWESEPFCAPRAVSPEAVLEGCVYALTNMVATPLVKRGQQWEGVTTWNLEYGDKVVHRRPDIFFSEEMPAELEFTLVRPPGVRIDLDDRACRALVREVAHEREEALVAEHRRHGRRIIGMRAVKKQRYEDTPTSQNVWGALRPRYKGSGWELREAIQRDRVIIDAHKERLEAFRTGDRDAPWPGRTHRMCIRYNCPGQALTGTAPAATGPPAS